jgi:hypothetical protein
MSNWVNVVLSARSAMQAMQASNAAALPEEATQLAQCLIEACGALTDVHSAKIRANFAVAAFHAAFLLQVRFSLFYYNAPLIVSSGRGIQISRPAVKHCYRSSTGQSQLPYQYRDVQI